jgi:hypothetical protein
VNGYIAEVKHMFKWAVSNTQNYERIGQINISASGVPLGYEEVYVCQSPPEIPPRIELAPPNRERIQGTTSFDVNNGGGGTLAWSAESCTGDAGSAVRIDLCDTKIRLSRS